MSNPVDHILRGQLGSAANFDPKEAQAHAVLQMQQERAMQARVTALQLAISHHHGLGEAAEVVQTAATFELFIAGAPNPPTEQRQ